MKTSVWISAVALLIQICYTVPDVKSEKILFFFMGGSFSHKVGIWPLVTALAERGHNVTYVSPYKKQPFGAKAEIIDIVLEAHQPYTEQAMKTDRLGLRREGNAKEFWNFKNPSGLCQLFFANPLKDPKIDYLIREAEFDLLVVNAVFGECAFVLNHRYQAKIIVSSSSFYMPWFSILHGYSPESSWIPDITDIFYYPMSMFDRIRNIGRIYYWTYLRHAWAIAHDELMRKVYKSEKYLSVVDMELNSSLMLVNNHLGSVDLARSLPPFVVQIGGMQCWMPKKELPAEYQTYLDGATDGAMLMTFGSATDLSDTPPYFKEIMFQAFKELPNVRFIIKWTGELPPDAPSNIKASSWIPQFEILSHPNIKGFISHGGGNGLMEAVYFGVPIITLPLYADQDYNGYVVEATGMGIRLELQTLVPLELAEAVKKILRDDSYSKQMKVKSEIFRDRPMDPISTGVFWTEFVLRHDDTKALKPLRHLHPLQQQLWDVYLVLWMIATVSLAVVFYAIRYFRQCFCMRQNSTRNIFRNHQKKE